MSPAMLFIILLIIDLTAFFWAASVGDRPSSYMGEGDPYTFLSSFQLLSAGLIALFIFYLRFQQESARNWKASYWIWLLMGAGFVILAIDDIGQLHENIDKWIHQGFNLNETSLTDRIDDMVIVLYGLTGMACMWFYRREFTGYRSALGWLIPGAVFTVLSIGLDAGTQRTDLVRALISEEKVIWLPWFEWSQAVEEGFKLLAGSAFICAACHCLLLTRSRLSGNG